MTGDTGPEGFEGGPGDWTGPHRPPILVPPDPLPCHVPAISLRGAGSAHSETGQVSQEGH